MQLFGLRKRHQGNTWVYHLLVFLFPAPLPSQCSCIPYQSAIKKRTERDYTLATVECHMCICTMFSGIYTLRSFENTCL